MGAVYVGCVCSVCVRCVRGVCVCRDMYTGCVCAVRAERGFNVKEGKGKENGWGGRGRKIKEEGE